MATEWIKIEHILPDKPEVFKIAEILGIDPDSVVGKLVRLWSWCDQQTVDGCALGVTDSFIDRLTHQPGFSDALRKVDWLQARSGSLAIPRFARHNGQTAKARAESARRMAKSRDSKKPQPNPNECCGNVAENTQRKPQPEKEREEDNKNTPHPARGSEAAEWMNTETRLAWQLWVDHIRAEGVLPSPQTWAVWKSQLQRACKSPKDQGPAIEVLQFSIGKRAKSLCFGGEINGGRQPQRPAQDAAKPATRRSAQPSRPSELFPDGAPKGATVNQW